MNHGMVSVEDANCPRWHRLQYTLQSFFSRF